MGKIDNRLKELGIELPESAAPIANYVPAVKTGCLLYLSGMGPANKPDGTQYLGKVGSDLSIEDGYDAARLTGINLLARLKSELGDFDKVTRIVKLLGMVNSDFDFDQHPSIINGCSDLLVEVFGDKGKHARSAVGMSGLPNNIPVEIEMIVEISD